MEYVSDIKAAENEKFPYSWRHLRLNASSASVQELVAYISDEQKLNLLSSVNHGNAGKVYDLHMSSGND